MKYLIFLLSSFVAFSCSQTIASNMITKGCVASVCVGADESVLRTDFLGNVHDSTVNREGDEYPALRVVFDDNSSIVLELENSSVWAIRVSDSKLITAKGVSVGSTFSEVKKAYPDAILNYGEEDGGYISLFVKELNGFFSFDTKNIFSGVAERSSDLNEKSFYKLKARIILIHNM